MDFLGTITPRELAAGRVLSFVTMAAMIGSGVFPPLRRHAFRIRVVAATVYIGCVLGFVLYCLLFRYRGVCLRL